jgi:uncharacterized protein DUF4202
MERWSMQRRTVLPIRGVGLSMQASAQSGGEAPRWAPSVSCPIWALSSEFPTVRWALMAQPPSGALIIPERAWRAAPVDFHCWDRAVSDLWSRPRWVVVQGEGAETLDQTAREVLTRYQRLVPRTNAHSDSLTFHRVLSGHRAMHDLSKSPVRADYDHALDAWQWVLRLAPGAGLAVQLAALFHDVGRLVVDVDRRAEAAAGAASLANAHAEPGAKIALEVLAACGVAPGTCSDVARLIRQHEGPNPAMLDADLRLLADADALSFFSLNSSGFADGHGAVFVRDKMRYRLSRMSSAAIRRLADIRLREDVARCLADVVRAEARVALERDDARAAHGALGRASL